jgi:hypothetical protein
VALSKNTLPSITPTWALPFDDATAFAKAQTLTATGYFDNLHQQIDVGPGRFNGLWALDVSAATVADGDQKYQFFLLGSNDANWANGNVELLAVHDIAATAALRLVPTITAVSDAVPSGGAASRFVMPFSNQKGEYVFRYLRAYCVIAGTTKSVTATTWVTPDTAG